MSGGGNLFALFDNNTRKPVWVEALRLNFSLFGA